MARIMGVDTSKSGISFTDVESNRWSYSEITSLVDAGVLTGYPDKTFRPERIIDRGEMAAVLNRVTDTKGSR